nr:transposase [Mycobacterium riyadhense]
MALGCENRQGRFDDAMLLVGDQLPEGSIYRLLAEHGGALFGDDYFADLFKASTRGRPTVPARVVATVMLLQAYEGLSDREACDRLAFDLRWKAAAGLTVGAEAFHPTVLVGMRNRLRKSDRPRRLFDDVNTTAQAAGLLRGRRRVLDSTPLFDAVATQDTVIQLRAAIRKVLSVADRADPALAGAVRQVLTATMTTPAWVSRRATGTTRKPESRWWMRWPAMPRRRWRCWMAASWTGRSPKPPSCWGWWPAKTSRPARMGCFVSPGGWPGIG